KHFEYGRQPHTVVTYEYPDSFAPGKEPYYPVNDEKNGKIYEAYRQLALNTPDVLFGGRLGRYTYADMDDTVAAALKLACQIF
ncbi:MAG: UDP-galactopyranose mutase, partial [Candidatus Paraprevotella stercoravium]|nr:UDP-galactopyranose mutase [Candidatus Paraprevotella stercoravium]